MRDQISFGAGLTIILGDRAATLSPSAALVVAEKLIRRSTSAIIADQSAYELKRMAKHQAQTKGRSNR